MAGGGDQTPLYRAENDIARRVSPGTLVFEVFGMAALRHGGRTLAALAAASLGLAAGCYSATPHRAQVASNAAPRECSAAVADVFTRSGFIQVATPPKVSMLFTARTSGPYSSFLSTNTAVGVTLTQPDGEGTCQVTIEALSPDVDCPPPPNGTSGTLYCQPHNAPMLGSRDSAGYGVSPPMAACPVVPQPNCPLTYAPGAENDAAVDELAHRVQVALGTEGHVSQMRAP
jgi:hypothetical protein